MAFWCKIKVLLRKIVRAYFLYGFVICCCRLLGRCHYHSTYPSVKCFSSCHKHTKQFSYCTELVSGMNVMPTFHKPRPQMTFRKIVPSRLANCQMTEQKLNKRIFCHRAPMECKVIHKIHLIK